MKPIKEFLGACESICSACQLGAEYALHICGSKWKLCLFGLTYKSVAYNLYYKLESTLQNFLVIGFSILLEMYVHCTYVQQTKTFPYADNPRNMLSLLCMIYTLKFTTFHNFALNLSHFSSNQNAPKMTMV